MTNMTSNDGYERIRARRGFTIAEVLLAMVIIGVVASISLGVVYYSKNNSNHLDLVATLQSQTVKLNRAYKIALTDNDDLDRWVGKDSSGKAVKMSTLTDDQKKTELYASILKSYLKVSKDCGTGVNGNCFPTASANVNLTGSDSKVNYNKDNSYYKFQTADGASVAVKITDALCRGTGISNSDKGTCGEIIVDINGNKQPNKAGLDTYKLGIFYNGIKPFKAGCSNPLDSASVVLTSNATCSEDFSLKTCPKEAPEKCFNCDGSLVCVKDKNACNSLQNKGGCSTTDCPDGKEPYYMAGKFECITKAQKDCYEKMALDPEVVWDAKNNKCLTPEDNCKKQGGYYDKTKGICWDTPAAYCENTTKNGVTGWYIEKSNTCCYDAAASEDCCKAKYQNAIWQVKNGTGYCFGDFKSLCELPADQGGKGGWVSGSKCCTNTNTRDCCNSKGKAYWWSSSTKTCCSGIEKTKGCCESSDNGHTSGYWTSNPTYCWKGAESFCTASVDKNGLGGWKWIAGTGNSGVCCTNTAKATRSNDSGNGNITHQTANDSRDCCKALSSSNWYSVDKATGGVCCTSETASQTCCETSTNPRGAGKWDATNKTCCHSENASAICCAVFNAGKTTWFDTATKTCCANESSATCCASAQNPRGKGTFVATGKKVTVTKLSPSKAVSTDFVSGIWEKLDKSYSTTSGMCCHAAAVDLACCQAMTNNTNAYMSNGTSGACCITSGTSSVSGVVSGASDKACCESLYNPTAGSYQAPGKSSAVVVPRKYAESTKTCCTNPSSGSACCKAYFPGSESWYSNKLAKCCSSEHASKECCESTDNPNGSGRLVSGKCYHDPNAYDVVCDAFYPNVTHWYNGNVLSPKYSGISSPYYYNGKQINYTKTCCLNDKTLSCCEAFKNPNGPALWTYEKNYCCYNQHTDKYCCQAYHKYRTRGTDMWFDESTKYCCLDDSISRCCVSAQNVKGAGMYLAKGSNIKEYTRNMKADRTYFVELTSNYNTPKYNCCQQTKTLECCRTRNPNAAEYWQQGETCCLRDSNKTCCESEHNPHLVSGGQYRPLWSSSTNECCYTAHANSACCDVQYPSTTHWYFGSECCISEYNKNCCEATNHAGGAYRFLPKGSNIVEKTRAYGVKFVVNQSSNYNTTANQCCHNTETLECCRSYNKSASQYWQQGKTCCTKDSNKTCCESIHNPKVDSSGKYAPLWSSSTNECCYTEHANATCCSVQNSSKTNWYSNSECCTTEYNQNCCEASNHASGAYRFLAKGSNIVQKTRSTSSGKYVVTQTSNYNTSSAKCCHDTKSLECCRSYNKSASQYWQQGETCCTKDSNKTCCESEHNPKIDSSGKYRPLWSSSTNECCYTEHANATCCSVQNSGKSNWYSSSECCTGEYNKNCCEASNNANGSGAKWLPSGSQIVAYHLDTIVNTEKKCDVPFIYKSKLGCITYGYSIYELDTGCCVKNTVTFVPSSSLGYTSSNMCCHSATASLACCRAFNQSASQYWLTENSSCCTKDSNEDCCESYNNPNNQDKYGMLATWRNNECCYNPDANANCCSAKYESSTTYKSSYWYDTTLKKCCSSEHVSKECCTSSNNPKGAGKYGSNKTCYHHPNIDSYACDAYYPSTTHWYDSNTTTCCTSENQAAGCCEAKGKTWDTLLGFCVSCPDESTEEGCLSRNNCNGTDTYYYCHTYDSVCNVEECSSSGCKCVKYRCKQGECCHSPHDSDWCCFQKHNDSHQFANCNEYSDTTLKNLMYKALALELDLKESNYETTTENANFAGAGQPCGIYSAIIIEGDESYDSSGSLFNSKSNYWSYVSPVKYRAGTIVKYNAHSLIGQTRLKFTGWQVGGKYFQKAVNSNYGDLVYNSDCEIVGSKMAKDVTVRMGYKVCVLHANFIKDQESLGYCSTTQNTKATCESANNCYGPGTWFPSGYTRKYEYAFSSTVGWSWGYYDGGDNRYQYYNYGSGLELVGDSFNGTDSYTATANTCCHDRNESEACCKLMCGRSQYCSWNANSAGGGIIYNGRNQYNGSGDSLDVAQCLFCSNFKVQLVAVDANGNKTQISSNTPECLYPGQEGETLIPVLEGYTIDPTSISFDIANTYDAQDYKHEYGNNTQVNQFKVLKVTSHSIKVRMGTMPVTIQVRAYLSDPSEVKAKCGDCTDYLDYFGFCTAYSNVAKTYGGYSSAGASCTSPNVSVNIGRTTECCLQVEKAKSCVSAGNNFIFTAPNVGYCIPSSKNPNQVSFSSSYIGEFSSWSQISWETVSVAPTIYGVSGKATISYISNEIFDSSNGAYCVPKERTVYDYMVDCKKSYRNVYGTKIVIEKGTGIDSYIYSGPTTLYSNMAYIYVTPTLGSYAPMFIKSGEGCNVISGDGYYEKYATIVGTGCSKPAGCTCKITIRDQKASGSYTDFAWISGMIYPDGENQKTDTRDMKQFGMSLFRVYDSTNSCDFIDQTRLSLEYAGGTYRGEQCWMNTSGTKTVQLQCAYGYTPVVKLSTLHSNDSCKYTKSSNDGQTEMGKLVVPSSSGQKHCALYVQCKRWSTSQHQCYGRYDEYGNHYLDCMYKSS